MPPVPPASDGCRAYGVEETAHLLSVGRSTIFNELRAKRLRAIKIGRRTIVTEDEIKRYIAERTRESEAT